MSQFAAPVIPDESAKADEIRNPLKVQYNQILSGSRLAPAPGGLGRDDELRGSRLRLEGTSSDHAEVNTYASIEIGPTDSLPFMQGCYLQMQLAISWTVELAKEYSLPGAQNQTGAGHKYGLG